MKTRQARAKSPNSSVKEFKSRLTLHAVTKKLTRSFSNASVTTLSRLGGSNAGEELFASWNGKTLIITGLQDHHWHQLENEAPSQEGEEDKETIEKEEGKEGSEKATKDTSPVSPQRSEPTSEVQDANSGHQTEPKGSTINGNKTRTGARRGRPRGSGRGRKRSRLKSIISTREEKQLENEAYSPDKNYLKDFQQKAEDEEENLKKINNGSRSPRNTLDEPTHEQQATDTPVSTPSPVEIDDTITADDLPSPYLSRESTPSSSADLDAAALLMKERFLPLPSLSSFSDAMTRYAPAVRTTATLYALAENAQRALVSWQTEYLKLDTRTAPAAHPPKRPATGGRIPLDPATWDAIKQSELYGYTLDPRREPGAQDPFVQRGWRRGGAFASAARPTEPVPVRGSGRGRAGRSTRGNNHGRRLSSQDGRELRLRRKRGYADSGEDEEVEEEEEEEEEEEGRTVEEEAYDFDDRDYGSGSIKRGRRSIARFGNDTPDSKRGSAAPENEIRSEPVRKRGRPSTASILARQLQARGEASPSAPQVPRRRGRPPGSKNSARRSDAGIKKGPRVKPGLSPATISRTATPAGVGSSATIESSNAFSERDHSTGRTPSVNARQDGAKALRHPTSLSTTLFSTRHDTNSPSSLAPSSMHADEAVSPLNPTPNPYLESMHSAPSPAPTPIGSLPTTNPPERTRNMPDNASSPAIHDETSFHNHSVQSRQTDAKPLSISLPRHEKQPHAKSEKRSASITKWWAQRKAKEKEAATGAALKKPSPESPTTNSTGVRDDHHRYHQHPDHEAAQSNDDKNKIYPNADMSAYSNDHMNHHHYQHHDDEGFTAVSNMTAAERDANRKEGGFEGFKGHGKEEEEGEEEEDSMLGADSDEVDVDVDDGSLVALDHQRPTTDADTNMDMDMDMARVRYRGGSRKFDSPPPTSDPYPYHQARPRPRGFDGLTDAKANVNPNPNPNIDPSNPPSLGTE